eukprot:CAMPEP_0201519972 /NCGR_PEP_ID=MMETSP0161_2-20130828/10388_1 /ASSEMBLY_ACC=CAM_ASM_000251 /TAXON_ID=180227 /ORGANISM="Neoparamoeba aestuarina, Strain SoJaBio B1-5/56/2" /LENGTH=373 /DNA_ID=CAMNT_0047918177 /DNA_START=60 /DNA_END=1177 /DNA_ORIENTATION=+
MAEKQKKMKAASGRDRDTKFLEAAKRSKRSDIIANLQKGANINALDESSGFSALHLAVEQQSEECVNTLLMNGIDVKTVNLKGMGVMHVAAEMGSVAMIQLLLGKVPATDVVKLINCPDETGRTPLHLALIKADSTCASLLYQFEGSNISVVDQDGCLPLHYAAASGMTKDIDKLAKLGSDVNLQDKKGRTPLHHAAVAGSSGAALALFRHAVDANIVDNEKLTPAALAEKSGHSALAGVLKQKSQQSSESTSAETTDSSSKSIPLPTHRRRPPPLPTTLPPEPEEVDEFGASDVGLAPPDVPVPPKFIPKAAEIEDLGEGEDEDDDVSTHAEDNTTLSSASIDEEVEPPPPEEPVRQQIPPPAPKRDQTTLP